MIELYKEGIIPHIQVHDELNFSLNDDSMRKRIKDIMENCIQLEVPSRVDVKEGQSWGSIKA